MTVTFDMVSMVGADESEPVNVDPLEAEMFAGLFLLLCAAYLPDGMPALIEITPRREDARSTT